MSTACIRLAFDLSPATGLGHFHRCLCLAKHLESKKYKIELYAIGEANLELVTREQMLHCRKISHLHDMPINGPLVIVDSYLAKHSIDFEERISNYTVKAYIADSRDFPKWADRIVYPHLGEPKCKATDRGGILLEGNTQLIFDPVLCNEPTTKNMDSCVVILSGTETKFCEVEVFLSKCAAMQNIEVNFCTPSTPRAVIIDNIRKSELAIVSAGVSLIEVIAASCKPLPIKYAENQMPNLTMVRNKCAGFKYLERRYLLSPESEQTIKRFFSRATNQNVSPQQVGFSLQGTAASANFFISGERLSSF